MPVPKPNLYPPFNIVRLSHVDYDVKDLAASRAFYVDTLGLEVTHEDGDTIALRALEERGHHCIVLHRATAPAVRALSFKLIGKPVAPVGINPRPSSPSFALQVSPNPAASVADVRWSGAVGPVRIEVLDARGRRVASGQGGAAGSWSFARTGRGGQALSAGVYFVHARDSAGGHAVERVVLIP